MCATSCSSYERRTGLTASAGDSGSEVAAGKVRVLIVEDEYLVAMMIQDMVEGMGYAVSEIAGTIEVATAEAEAGAFDVALLDVNLNGAYSTSVAEILVGRGIPFAFVTGYGSGGPHDGFEAVPALAKPLDEAELKRTLAMLCPGSHAAQT